MTFQFPQVFFLLVIIIPLLIVFLLGKRRTESVIIKFKSRPPRFWYYASRVVFAFLFIGSLVAVGARPYSELKKTGDYVFLVDVSLSMQARNSCVEPPFLDRAKQVMRKILSGVPEGRFGIVAYERLTFPITHMTFDHAYLEEVVEHGIYPGLIYDRTDTQTGRALSLIAEKKERLPEIYGGLEYVILLTDGYMENSNRSLLGESLQKLKKAGIRVLTVGIGNQAATPIPTVENGECVDKFIVKDGQLITITLQRDTLEFISSETQGRYFGEVEIMELIQYLREETLKQTFVESVDVYRQRDDISWLFMTMASIGLFGFVLLDFGVRSR